MYVYHMHAWCLQRPEKDIRSLGFRVTDTQYVLATKHCGFYKEVWSRQLFSLPPAFFAKKKQDLKLQTFACL